MPVASSGAPQVRLANAGRQAHPEGVDVHQINRDARFRPANTTNHRRRTEMKNNLARDPRQSVLKQVRNLKAWNTSCQTLIPPLRLQPSNGRKKSTKVSCQHLIKFGFNCYLNCVSFAEHYSYFLEHKSKHHSKHRHQHN